MNDSSLRVSGRPILPPDGGFQKFPVGKALAVAVIISLLAALAIAAVVLSWKGIPISSFTTKVVLRVLGFVGIGVGAASSALFIYKSIMLKSGIDTHNCRLSEQRRIIEAERIESELKTEATTLFLEVSKWYGDLKDNLKGFGNARYRNSELKYERLKKELKPNVLNKKCSDFLQGTEVLFKFVKECWQCSGVGGAVEDIFDRKEDRTAYIAFQKRLEDLQERFQSRSV